MDIIADKAPLLRFSSWKVTAGVTWQKSQRTSKNENYFLLLLPRLFKMDSNKEVNYNLQGSSFSMAWEAIVSSKW